MTHERIAGFALFGVAFMAISACDTTRQDAQTADSAQQADSAVVLRLLPYQGRLRTVSVKIGTDSFAFLFDTGGGWTLLSPELAQKLSCNAVGRSVGHRMSGERLDVPICSGQTTLSVDGFTARPAATGVFDLMKLLPSDWPALHGVISLSTFADRAITLDLARNQLIIESPSTLARRTAGMTALKARLATGDDGAALVLFVATQAANGELWLEFDSGNLDDLLLSPHAMQVLAGRAVTDTATVPLKLTGGAAATVRGRVRPLIYDGVLNAGFIEQHVFTMDLASGRVWCAC
jgi:hypothetical protein